MTVQKEDVRKALAALDLPENEEVAKGEKAAGLGEAEGAATEGGSLKAPGESMTKKIVKKSRLPKAPAEKKEEDDAEEDAGEEKKEEGSEEEEEEEEEEEKKSMPADFHKSLPNEIVTKIDVSNFLRSLVDHTADSMDQLRDFVAKSDMAHESRYDEVVDAVDGLQKSMANVGIVLQAICERIGVIENKPARIAKSVSADAQVVKGVQPVERNIENNDPVTKEEGGEGVFKSLVGKSPQIQKSIVASALCDMVKKGEAKDTDVINFETYGFVGPELEPKLRALLG